MIFPQWKHEKTTLKSSSYLIFFALLAWLPKRPILGRLVRQGINDFFCNFTKVFYFWGWFFHVFRDKKKYIYIYLYIIKAILCIFLVRTLGCFQKKNCPWKHEKTTLKRCSWSAQALFFCIANRPKSSPDLNSCSIKISHPMTSL